MMPSEGSATAVEASPGTAARAPAAEAAWLASPARLLALLPLGAFILMALAPPLNHDVAALLVFTERWLAGEALYRDLLDVNPPLIFLLSAVPVLIGQVTPLSAEHAVPLCVLALGLGAVRLARRAAPRTGPIEAACLGVGVPLATVAAGYDFAQREHLMAIAALPYLLLAARRLEGGSVPPPLALGIALLAAAGFALKPHFLLLPAAVEALLLWRRGWRPTLADPVPWTMAALWLAYLAAVLALFPGYAAQILPLAFGHYAGLHDFSWWQVILSDRVGTGLLLLAPLAVLALPGRRGGLAQVLAVAAVAAAVAAILQAKGWSYHALPLRLLAALLAVAMLARWLDAALPDPRARHCAAPVAALAMLGFGVFQAMGAEGPWRQITWSWSEEARLGAAIERAAADRPLLVLSPSIYPVFPAVNYARAAFTLPAMTIWPLQGAYATCAPGGARYRDPAAMTPVERGFAAQVIDRMVRVPPAAILVAVRPGIPNCGRGFDLVEYFARLPRFAALFRQYRQVAEVGGHRLYARIR